MLYMFQAVPPPMLRSSKTIHTATGICYAVTANFRCRGGVGTTNTKCRINTVIPPDDGPGEVRKHVEVINKIDKIYCRGGVVPDPPRQRKVAVTA
jgi:hypothetical protein